MCHICLGVGVRVLVLSSATKTHFSNCLCERLSGKKIGLVFKTTFTIKCKALLLYENQILSSITPMVS